MISKGIFLLSLIFLFIMPVAQLSVKASPTVIRVPGDYPKIQEAISNANPGDTIEVSSGIYYETLFIDKKLALVGESKDTTVLSGNGGVTVIQVNFTTVTISGLTIINGTYGIVLESCSESVITENVIRGPAGGIWLHYSNSNIVSDNYVLDSGWCGIVLCGGSSENKIMRNTIRNNACGLIMTGTGNLIYQNNIISANHVLMVSSFENVWNNGYEGNYWSDYNGTEFDNYGIGKVPYIIDAINEDHCPLKNPYISGDVNHDAKVSIVDISIIAKAFGTQLGDTLWNPHADLDENVQVNIVDISIAAKNFGREWENP